MLFYRVKPEFDQQHHNPKIADGNIYIKNELYTAKEVARKKLNLRFLESVEVKKNKTYWFFGARFACEEK